MSKSLYQLKYRLFKNGFIYRQIRRSDKAAIYVQVDRESGNFVAFEVFTIKIQRERKFDERVFPEKEHFPSNEDFGKFAWSVRTLEKAKVIFQRLNSEE